MATGGDRSSDAEVEGVWVWDERAAQVAVDWALTRDHAKVVAVLFALGVPTWYMIFSERGGVYYTVVVIFLRLYVYSFTNPDLPPHSLHPTTTKGTPLGWIRR